MKRTQVSHEGFTQLRRGNTYRSDTTTTNEKHRHVIGAMYTNKNGARSWTGFMWIDSHSRPCSAMVLRKTKFQLFMLPFSKGFILYRNEHYDTIKPPTPSTHHELVQQRRMANLRNQSRNERALANVLQK